MSDQKRFPAPDYWCNTVRNIQFSAKSAPKDLFELVRKEDIDDLMSVFSTARLHYVAADGWALFMREAIDKMDDNT